MNFEDIVTAIIAYSGESISASMEAVERARNKDTEQCKMLMAQAMEAKLTAHNLHTQLIIRESKGEKLNITLLLVHASNHLSNADMLSNVAECFIRQYLEDE